MGAKGDYDRWFEEATGHAPYVYQRALADAERPPSVLDVPTGAGKTQALLGAWMFQREKGTAPRRLVYALPMRTLVEQTTAVAVDMRARAGVSPDEMPVHVLMGGTEQPSEDWRMQPERHQVLIGTIDMLVSRALNRGYAESRFAWPVAFGLLNSDCRWVFDEVQLMGPARATTVQLDGLRAKLGTDLGSESTWVSATVDRDQLTTVDRPELGEVLELPAADRTGDLAARLTATKTAQRVEVDDAGRARQIADLCAERHEPGTRTLVVLNTVRDAQEVYRELGRLLDEAGPGAVLVHSRYRRADRAAHLSAALAEPTGRGTIVISTQVIEAGVDLSSKTLVTALAPFSAIVQRLGRCNRAGEHEGANVLWLDPGEIGDDKRAHGAAAPYLPADLRASRAALTELEGESLSPARLSELSVAEVEEDTAVLRRRDLLDLFDTSPDLSGSDIDVAPFIRADDERTVSVFFRALGSERPPRIEADAQPLPAPDELVQVPRADLSKRAAWVQDHVDGGWLRRTGWSVPPGAAVLLAAEDGGYDGELGWAPTRNKGAVEAAEPEVSAPPESFPSDDVGSKPETLMAHLEAVAAEAHGLATAIGLNGRSEVLKVSGALHDLGKAHEVFQDLMRNVIGSGDEVWAKSGTRGGRYKRRFFRHELASALAFPAVADSLGLADVPLTRYLIGAHHGKVRLSIRPAPTEEPPPDLHERGRFALGLVDGDVLPATQTPLGSTPELSLSLEPMELGAEDSWADAAIRLRDDPGLGPFRLGLLEAVLRVADWRVSGA